MSKSKSGERRSSKDGTRRPPNLPSKKEGKPSGNGRDNAPAKK